MDEDLYSYYAYAVRFNLKDKYEKLSDEILELINAGKDIPNSLAKDLLDTMDFTDMPYADEMARKCLYITSRAVEYFRTYDKKNYFFEGFKIVNVGGKVAKRAYTLHNLFYTPIIEYFKQKNAKGEISDKDAIVFFYKAIKKYRNKMFSEKHKKDCNHSKATVMSVYLLYNVEPQLYDWKEMNYDDMFDFGNNKLKTIKNIKI